MFGQEINVHISPLGGIQAAAPAGLGVLFKDLISPFLNKWGRNLKHPQEDRTLCIFPSEISQLLWPYLFTKSEDLVFTFHSMKVSNAKNPFLFNFWGIFTISPL